MDHGSEFEMKSSRSSNGRGGGYSDDDDDYHSERSGYRDRGPPTSYSDERGSRHHSSRRKAATAIGETAREETALKNRRVDPSKAITAVAARGRIRALRAIVLRRVIAAAARGLRDHMDREGAGRAIVVIGRAVRAILAGAIGMGLRGGEIDMMIMMRKYRGLLPYLKLRGVVVIRWCSSKALTLNSFKHHAFSF